MAAEIARKRIGKNCCRGTSHLAQSRLMKPTLDCIRAAAAVAVVEEAGSDVAAVYTAAGVPVGATTKGMHDHHGGAAA